MKVTVNGVEVELKKGATLKDALADTDYVDYVIPTDFITSGVGAEFNSVGWARFDYMNDVSEGSVDVDYWMFTNYPESEVMICDIAQVWSQQDGLYDMNVYLENDTENDITCNVYAGIYGADGRLKAVIVKQDQQLAKDVRVTVGFGADDKYEYAEGDVVKVMVWDNEMRPLSDSTFTRNVVAK